MVRFLCCWLALMTAPLSALAVDARPDSLPLLRFDCAVVEVAGACLRERLGDEIFERYVRPIELRIYDERGERGEVTSITLSREGYTGAPQPEPFQYDARPEVWFETTWECHLPNANACRFPPGS